MWTWNFRVIPIQGCPTEWNTVFEAPIKFIFLKTPQVRHGFLSYNKNHVFPIIRHEIYFARLIDDTYEFSGKSFSGSVHVDDFMLAIREGFVTLITEEF